MHCPAAKSGATSAKFDGTSNAAASYAKDGFATYANLALASAQGKDWTSAQFLFSPTDAADVQNHWVGPDHDQTITGSFGASYRWTQSRGATRLYADALYGSGLRTDATAADGTNILNEGTVPAYCSVNLGLEQSFQGGRETGGQGPAGRGERDGPRVRTEKWRRGGGERAAVGGATGVLGSLTYQFRSLGGGGAARPLSPRKDPGAHANQDQFL